jgi:hypothetical protein
MSEVPDGIRLADFLADLRDELSLARERATGPLKLGVDEVTLTVDVAYSSETSGQVGGRAKATFWAVVSGEVSAQASRSSGRTQTHSLTLTLKPRIEEIITDAAGNQRVVIRSLDVAGALQPGEENPDLPAPVSPDAAQESGGQG